MCVCLCHCSREPALIRSNLLGRHSVRSGDVTISGHAKVPRTTSLCVATQEILWNISRSCHVRVIFFKLPRIECQQTTRIFLVFLTQNNVAKFSRTRQPNRISTGIGKFSQEQRYPLPVGPIERTSAGLVLG